ncbi:hypothetical protein MLD38_027498 [Melastoma candidum]|uniref:Uncharacterized protein n=1 Tax=Melastoma candidum TaxID=119954 RepID=A0ACB9P3I9_9MYRT|nr:hypothetical protein MLD38_027498 [Melastoma candidum]
MPEEGRVLDAKEYPGNLTPYVILTCILAASGGLIFGYDIGISGGVSTMPSFLEKFFPAIRRDMTEGSSRNQYCQYDSQLLTMFISSSFLAALLASLVASTVTRKLGRNIAIFFGGILFLAGGIVNGFAKALWMLILGRMLIGFGIGFVNQSVPLYLSEMAPYKRFLFLEGGIQMLISQVVVAACIGAQFGLDGNVRVMPKWCAIVLVLVICIYVSGFAWSWGPLAWLVPSEIFPLEIRSTAQSINVSVNMLVTWAVAQMFLSMLCHLKFGLFLLLAFFVLIMTLFVYYFLPETKCVPIEDAIVWKRHLLRGAYE